MYSNNDNENYFNNSDSNQIGFFSHQSSNSSLPHEGISSLNLTPQNSQQNFNMDILDSHFVKVVPCEEIVDTSNPKGMESYLNNNFHNEIEISQYSSDQHTANNIDQIISKLHNEIKALYYNHQFEEIIRVLETQFPNVKLKFLIFQFLNKNKEILYFLMKMTFFYLLLVKEDYKLAESFYFEHFRKIIIQTKKNWERKEQNFLKIMKNPVILKNKNVFYKNLDNFIFDLDKELYYYLYASRNEEDFQLKSRSNSIEMIGPLQFGMKNLDLGRIHSNSIDSNISNQHIIEDGEVCRNQEEIKELSQFSTKEEFSDFEEEIENHLACHDDQINNLNQISTLPNNILEFPYNFNQIPSSSINNISNPQINTHQYVINPNYQYTNNLNFIKFIENKNKLPVSINLQNGDAHTKQVDTSNFQNNFKNFLNQKYSNYNYYNKPFIPKIQKNEESLHKKLPLLKSFKPKYTKRENIDKKILRKFKLYLKDKYKQKVLNLNSNLIDKHFWNMFINGNLLPPMKFIDNNTGENIEFKSFNSKFLLWLFNKKGAKDFYEKFLKEEGNSVVADISADYSIQDSNDINQLTYYMNNLAFIFDLHSVCGSDLNEKKVSSISNNTKNANHNTYSNTNISNNKNASSNNIYQAPLPIINPHSESLEKKPHHNKYYF